MHTRELTINSKSLYIRNGQAGQAGRRLRHRPLRRFGRARHGLPRRQRARGHRFPAAHGRLSRVRLRFRTHSWRLLQARRQGGGKGSADEPRHRPADPSALPVRMALRDADHRARLSADNENDTDVLAITGASAAIWRCRRSPSRRRSPASASASSTVSTSSIPTFEQRKASKLDLVVAGSKDGLVMVEAGAKEVTEAQVVEALDAAHAAIKQIVDDHRRPRQGRRQDEADGHQEGDSPTTSTRRWKSKVLVPLTEAMRIREQARELRQGRRGARRARGFDSGRRRSNVARDAKSIFKELKEKVLRDEVLERRRSSRRSQVRRGPTRSGSKRACCHARMARQCSHAARRRRSSRARSAPPMTRRRSRASRARRGRASCSTTTSRPSRSAKWRSCADRDGEKSAMARWRNARSCRCFPARRQFPYTVRSCPTFSSRTGRRRWRRSAADRWR